MDVASLVVHAHVLTDAGSIERQEIIFAVSTPHGAEGCTEPEIRRELLVLDVARAREDAVAHERRGDHHGAGQVLRAAAMRIAESSPELAAQLESGRVELESGRVELESERVELASSATMVDDGHGERILRGRPEVRGTAVVQRATRQAGV